MTLAAPLTPRDADLRDFPRMMIDITRLRQSSFDATINDAAWRAGLNLWFSAWHALPAGSLDNDDGALAKAAGLGRDVRTWREVKEEALRGFVLCSDNRLYHDTVCEFVLEAWIEKLLQRISSGAGNARRWSIDFDPEPIEQAITEAATLLAKLSPTSKTLVKIRRNRSRTAPTGNPTGKGDASHRDQQSLPLGSQETERLKRQGQGNKEEESKQHDSTPETAGETPLEGDPQVGGEPSPLSRDDLLDLANRIARVGAVTMSPLKLGHFNDQLKQVEAWLRDGIDPDMMVAEIGKALARTKEERIGHLKFYDAALRKALARKVEKETPHKSTMAAPSPSALRAQDADDDRVRSIRTALNGNADMTPDKIALAFEDHGDGPVLLVTARSAYVRSRVDLDRLREIAGTNEIEVRVQ